MSLPVTRDYLDLFLTGAPLLDVRAPVEFAKGAFPGAWNLPLLEDSERHQVGIRYKHAGQDAAITLGHELVGGAVRAARTAAWAAWCRQHPEGYLYCFRGGLRSCTVQQWLADEGVTVPLVQGGYKAMRRFLLERFQQDLARTPLLLVCGRTGTGKTRVIEALDRALDLEGRAHHRGSAFGRRPGGQPAQIDFENALAIDLLRLRHTGDRPVALEDEGRLVGRCALPLPLQAAMKTAPQIMIEESLASRVTVTLEDYVIAPVDEYLQLGDAGQTEQDARARLGESLLAALDRIRKRLGGLQHARLRAQLQDALALQARTGSPDAHRVWIESLLRDYYDPMYDYMLGKRDGQALFTGSRAEVLAWLRERCA
ncbi:tRNA 2-selenouridine(34) synthase MnmH [Isoalcanivorax indicus]|uniref:tRNA 2-selenouridine(34) synthase MnmH n=1 Tax=Isoalcanivorax indicus TaxID=2202653 RepID=UPI000DBA4351|nr:tRNA 2-selenouridine(34) synthase MnmH [Isoalcanivorax indicus]